MDHIITSYADGAAQWAAHRSMMADRGVILPSIKAYLPEGFKNNSGLALDAAIPGLTTDPNAGIPSMLTTMIDPDVFRIIFAPMKAAEIVGEVRKGSWLDETIMFPVVEHTGEVSSYGDYATNGSAGLNTNFPNRQAYLFQTIKQYGERELERAGLAKIGFVSEIDAAAALALNKYQNFTYFFGVGGLQNYGLLNDPNLSAALTPATKTAGGTAWIVSNVIKATANEVYADIESLYSQLVAQTNGTIDQYSKMCLAMSPGSSVALTATNTFNVNVNDLLKKNFPNMRIETATQYGVLSTSNQQGVAGGNLVQLIVEDIEGQKTAFCAFNEKMRGHPIIRALSSFQQKITAGSWGTVIRMPVGISQMLGV